MTYSDDFLAWLKKDECRLYMSRLDAQYAAWRAAIESRADARQPAAIDKEAVTPVRIADAERAAYKVSGHRAGEKWTKAFAEALLATPLAKEASKPAAPSVKQDEHGAFDPKVIAASLAPMIVEWVEGGIRMGTDWRDMAGVIEKRIKRLARAASTSANVGQGAEAVATVKVYETYTGQNGWIEVTQEEYDRTKDKYEHRILRVPAPLAQTGNKRD